MSALALDETARVMPSTEVHRLMPEPPRSIRSLDLVALPSAVTVTRLFVAQTLWRWRARFIEQNAELVATELVRHSVEASGTAGIDWLQLDQLDRLVVRLIAYEQSIVIEVWDTMADLDERPNQITEPRSLAVADARAKQWGIHPAPRGRVLWAELDVYDRTAAGLPKRQARLRRRSSLERTVQDLTLLQRIREGISRL